MGTEPKSIFGDHLRSARSDGLREAAKFLRENHAVHMTGRDGSGWATEPNDDAVCYPDKQYVALALALDRMASNVVGSNITTVPREILLREELIARLINFMDAALYGTGRGKLRDMEGLRNRLHLAITHHVQWNEDRHGLP